MNVSKVLTLALLMLISCNQESNPVDSNTNKAKFISVPLTRQATNYTCGVAALQSLLYYYGDEYRQDVLAGILQTDSIGGTRYMNIVNFCKSEGYYVSIHNNLSVDSLKNYINNGIPMLLAIQAWSDNPENYKDGWDDGHYVLAIGYDMENFYFMDPSTLGNYTYIPLNDFLDRWHDIDQDNNKLYNFAIRISKDKVNYQPELVLKLE